MTLDQLRYFYEVAKCLSFSQASHNLYISQPNLTKYIANLEKELGFKLLDRSTHHCELTDEGRAFVQHTEELFYQLNSQVEGIKLRARDTKKQMVIGNAQGELPPHEFLLMLNELNRSNRATRCLLRDDGYSNLISKLRTREYDMIITPDKNVRLNNEFNVIPLQSFEILLAVHKSNPKSSQTSLLPKDCANEMVFISIPDGHNAPTNRVEEIFIKTGSRLNITILDSPEEVMVNAQIGAGIAMVPSTIDERRYHDMVYYRYGPPQESIQVLAWRKDETRPDVLEFIKQIQALAPFTEHAYAPRCMNDNRA